MVGDFVGDFVGDLSGIFSAMSRTGAVDARFIGDLGVGFDDDDELATAEFAGFAVDFVDAPFVVEFYHDRVKKN